MADRPTVAVIGAGFSGVLTALRLLLAPDGPRVLLIERGPRFGRGAAYATASPHHLLNVRAANMSALVEQPSHFLDWLAAAGVAPADQAFVTRDRYGQYLQSMLREATGGEAAGRLVLEQDEAAALVRETGRWGVRLALGRTLAADAVVLALGNLPPPPPLGLSAEAAASGRYVAEPWAWTGSEAHMHGDVLILGSGLTAIDVALTIEARRPGTRILALSRHGLLPRAHGDARSGPGAGPSPTGSPAAVLAAVRARAGDDWRGAIDDLRPHVQGLWRSWSVAERRRFLRHLRPWWDVHRHRLAPQVAERLQRLRAQGVFTAEAGRIERLDLATDAIEASWTPRGGGARRRRGVALVINCAGPPGDVERSDDPLIADLLAGGLIRADACRLGIDVDERSRAVAADGEAEGSLFAVGPITRGQFYEITAVPDIRIQAADCAGAVLNLLAIRARTAPASASARHGTERLIGDLSAFLAQSMAELDVELGSLKFARRVRGAWELRGRRAALGEIALWLDDWRARRPDVDR